MWVPGAISEGLPRVEAFVRENPELVAVAGLVAAVVLVSTYALVRSRRPAGVDFRRLLAEKAEIAVLMHPNPDPDAMASAIGIASLADQLDVDATLQFPGQIRHQENRAFRTVLDLELDRIDHVSDLAAESVVLVDHNEARGFAGAEGVLPTAVVDHHPGDGAGEE